MRIAINGMGRIGRLLFRRLLHHASIDIVAVNDIMDPLNLVYLLNYDSVYGKSNMHISYSNKLLAGQKEINCFREAEPLKLPWRDLQIDLVLECSGYFTTNQKASQHLTAGAGKVLLSTTGSDDIPLLIYGFNQNEFNHDNAILSPGGCMTNCTTPLIDVLSSLCIESVQLHIIHSYTSRQHLVDTHHKDFRRGRAAADSMIPVPVDLAVSLERLFPQLHKRIAAVSTRVPISNGAITDFTIQCQKVISADQVNSLLQHSSHNKYKGIIEYTEDPIVSSDVRGNKHSAVIDGTLTSVVEKQLKLFSFFDNEYGYTSRIIDWLIYLKHVNKTK